MFQVRNITRRHARSDRSRRHDKDLNRILFRRIRKKMSARHKRDTLAHVEDVMRDVQGKIHGLKVGGNYFLLPI